MASPETILDSTEQQLKLAQGKVTYLGEQSKPIATVVFHTEGYNVLLERFEQFQAGNKRYVNDELPYTTSFTVKPVEYKKILNAVRPVVERAKGGAEPDFLSFTVVRESAGILSGQEFKIGRILGKEFFSALIDALEPGNKPGRSALGKQSKNVYPE